MQTAILNQVEYREVLERVYEYLEADDLGKAVMACLRLARHNQDHMNTALFLLELNPDRTQLHRIFLEDTAKLNAEQQKVILKKAVDAWLAGRQNELVGRETSLDDGNRTDAADRANVFVFGAGQLDAELKRIEACIQDMTLPPGMSPFDVAAFTDRFLSYKAPFRLYMQQIQTVRERIKVRCLNYAISLERQLEAQQRPEKFLHHIQNEVNNYFKAHSEDVYLKLQKAALLVDSGDVEDHSALLTVVRRALSGAADFFYPAQPELVTCADGVKRNLSEQEFLNRMHEYLSRQFGRTSSVDLLRAEAALLANFFRRLNAVASKGVHAKVSSQEAKQGLVGLYLFLYNVIGRLQSEPETN